MLRYGATMKPSISGEPGDHLHSFGRAMALLRLTEDQGRITIAEANRYLGIPTASAHRLLHALAREGFLEVAAKGFRLGPALVDLGLAAACRLDIRQAAHDPLVDLARTLHETTGLHVLRGRYDVGLDSVEADRTLRVSARAGVSVLANTSAAGKVLLAHLPIGRVRALFASRVSTGAPSGTVAWGRLERELGEVRESQWAADLEGSEPEVHAVAVPLHTPDGRVAAALSIAAPRTRLPEKDMPGIAAHLREASQRATDTLCDQQYRRASDG
jgi:IclR family acetate operon transcriptional repressor